MRQKGNVTGSHQRSGVDRLIGVGRPAAPNHERPGTFNVLGAAFLLPQRAEMASMRLHTVNAVTVRYGMAGQKRSKNRAVGGGGYGRANAGLMAGQRTRSRSGPEESSHSPGPVRCLPASRAIERPFLVPLPDVRSGPGVLRTAMMSVDSDYRLLTSAHQAMPRISRRLSRT